MRFSAARPPSLILASSKRRAILEQLGITFEVRVPEVEELDDGPPHEVAVENAYRKASAVADEAAVPVLGADTIVALGARIYGKPADRVEARATLEALSGARHLVIGGLCVLAAGRPRTAAVTTAVTFRGARGAPYRVVSGHRRVAWARRRVRDPGSRRGAGQAASRATI